MPYIPATCPNCKGNLRIDTNEEKGYCMHCGSLIDFKQAVKTIKFNQPIELAGYESLAPLLKMIEDALKNGENQTPEFKQRLYKALELDPDNQFLYDMITSQIWNAEIVDNVLVNYNGHVEKIVVPEGIISIGKMAFSHSNRLKEITLPKSLKQITEGAFIYEHQITINAYKNTYAAKYAMASPAKLNLIDIKTDTEKALHTIEGVLKELSDYEKSTKQIIESHFEKVYSINWGLISALLIIPIIILLILSKINLSRTFINISLYAMFLLFILIASPILIIKSGYGEIKRKVAVKIQSELFMKNSNEILKPLGIVDFKYYRNIFEDPNADLELEVDKLKRARDKVLNMDTSILYKKPYIYYPITDYFKGEKPQGYDKSL